MNVHVNRCSIRKTCARTAILFSIAASLCVSKLSAETQSFDDEASAAAAGWTAERNRDAGVGTDFGFAASNLSAGAASGEAGGVFPRLKFPWAYYADTSIGGEVTLASNLNASGKIYFDNANFDGGVDIGWMNLTGDVNSKAPWIGMEVLEGNRFRAAMFLPDGTELVGPNQTNHPANTTPESFTVQWDPAAGEGGGGLLTAMIADAQSVLDLTPEQAGALGPLNAFGLLTSTAVGNSNPALIGMLFVDDLDYSATSAPSESADFNTDADVDGDDLGVWQTGFGTQSGGTRATGDSNGDGDVDGDDFLVWERQFGTAPGSSAVSGVPEPQSLLLLVYGTLWGTLRNRKRRRAA